MLLFMDGQAHYDSSRIAMKYSTVGTTNATWSVTAEGRFGNCIKRLALSTDSAESGLGISPLTTRLGPWTPTISGVCGFAIKVDDLDKVGSVVAGYNDIIIIIEGQTHHMRVNLNPNGTFTLIRYAGSTSEGSSGPTIVAVSSEGLTEGVWMFVEFKWLLHLTAGTFEIRVNGVPVLTYAGRTIATGGFPTPLGVWNAVSIVGIGQVPFNPTPPLTLRLCDLYLADLNFSAADDVHDFLGDGTILTIMPNAPGAVANWTPSAPPNWDMVNDRPAPDDDDTYIATTTPGVTDLYNYENIPAGSIVKGVHVNILARKETEGAASVAPLVQPPGFGVTTGPTQGVANVVYDRYITQAFDINPGTGVRFTASDINNGQFGVVKTI